MNVVIVDQSFSLPSGQLAIYLPNIVVPPLAGPDVLLSQVFNVPDDEDLAVTPSNSFYTEYDPVTNSWGLYLTKRITTNSPITVTLTAGTQIVRFPVFPSFVSLFTADSAVLTADLTLLTVDAF